MEKLIDLTERAFMGEFIKLSPKVNELSEILWFVFRMGGSVTRGIITPRFPDADGDIRNLVEMGILREMDSGGKDRVVAFSDGFESRLITKNLSDITVNDIFDMLVDIYPKEMGRRYKLNDLMKSLSSVMAAVITYATPEEPAFLNKVFRAVGEEKAEVTPESLNQAKEMLEYYLNKYLGLVQPVGSFAVNLTGKAAQLVAKSPELSSVYKSKPVEGEKKPAGRSAAASRGD